MNEKPTQINPEIKLLRAVEVALILNVSQAYAYRRMQQGKIRTVVIAMKRRGRPAGLLDFIQKSLVPGAYQMSGK